MPSSITGSEIVSLGPYGYLDSSSFRVSVLDSCYLKDEYEIIFLFVDTNARGCTCNLMVNWFGNVNLWVIGNTLNQQTLILH